jgi:DNA-binding NarL/FixJ family response regulator
MPQQALQAPERWLTVVGDDDRGAGTIRVAVAHSQRLAGAALGALLEREAGLDVVGEAADGDAAVALVHRLRPDVLLIDIDIPGVGCVEATRRMLSESPVAVMVLSPSEHDGRLFQAMRAGASGLVLANREPAELVRAVRRLAGQRGPRRGSRYERSRRPEMISPKVIEMRRGAAHGPVRRVEQPLGPTAQVRLVKALPRRRARSEGGRAWNSVI